MQSDLRYPKVNGAWHLPHTPDYVFANCDSICCVKGYRLIKQVGGGGFSTCVRSQG